MCILKSAIINLTQLQTPNCLSNQLDATAFTAILNTLPERDSGNNAKCILFKDDEDEQNYKFTDPVPDGLKTAFENARDTKHWSLKKTDSDWAEDNITLP